MNRKGFTLVELIVVVAILGILIATLVVALGGSTDAAKAAKCLANMKNLAAAVQSYGEEVGYYPNAGSIEIMDIDSSLGKGNTKLVYVERRGWVSWASEGMYPSQSKQGAPSIPMCTSDELQAMYALTNGALWRYVDGSKSIFVCPLHRKKNPQARWSYVMNAYFGWSAAEGYAYSSRHLGIDFKKMSKSDRRLLFAEIPFQGAGDWFPDTASASTDSDGILQYEGCDKAPTVAGKGARDGNEHIGANHKKGRNWYAHVVFADGHTESLQATTGRGLPLNSENLRELTTWLCEGKSVSFDGKKYEELN